MAMPYRPHDLLFARTPAAFRAAGTAPDWVDADWMARAPLVVRRDTATPGHIPVGARGPQRNQRCAGELAAADVARCVTPERLAAAVLDGPALDLAAAAGRLPCIAALLALAPRLRTLGLEWGPAGGAGFWLASGLPVLRPTSDLDLLVRSPRPLSAASMAALCAMHGLAGSRIDIQVDTGAGGFALMEYARGGKTMLKTDHGPRLVNDPWEPQPQRAASEAA